MQAIDSYSKWLAPPWIVGLLPLVATVLPKGSVVLLAIIGVPALIVAWRQKALLEMFPKWALSIFLIALCWMTFRAFVTFDGVATIDKLARYSALIVMGFASVWWIRRLDREGRTLAGKSLVAGAVLTLIVIIVGVVIIKLDVRQHLPIERSDRTSIFNAGLIVLVLLSPIVIFHILRLWRKSSAIVFVVGTIGVAFFMGSSTAYLTAFVGIAVALICKKSSRQWAQLMAVLGVAVILAFPIVAPLVLDRIDVSLAGSGEEQKLILGDDLLGSLGHRYFIWRFALEKASERPMIGWGYDASRRIPGGHTTIDIGKELLPLHPHNEVLQVWLELGIPGLLILAAVVWLLYLPPTNARGLHTGAGNVRTTTITMLLATASVAFGVWQSWWVSSVLLTLALLYLCEKPAEES